MKNSFLLFALVITFILPIFAQKTHSPTLVKKAAYADRTIALRDMQIIMPGERVREWKNGVIGNKSIEMEFESNESDGFEKYNNLQQAKGAQSTRGPLINHDGVGNVSGVFPPDTDGDVGPNHYFQMINLAFAIWDKEGNLLYGPVDNSTLWAGFIGPWTGTNDGDPIVLYDEMADRWMASQFALNNGNGKWYQLVAISATPDPLGEYYRYAFEFDAMNDYPKMGVWPDGYYATFNFFSQGFIGSGVAAFERDKMLVGDPDANMVFFGYFDNKFSLQPSDMDGETLPPDGTPNFVATVNAGSSKQFEIYECKIDWETPSNSTYGLAVSLDPGYFNSDDDGVPQPGTNNRLDVLSRMLMYRLAYRNFGTHQAMVANHSVKVSGVYGIKWYEFRQEANDDWYIYQQGVYAPNDGIHRWMGSIAINAYGTIGLGFSASNETDLYPSIRYTGRPANAPLGEMTYAEIEAVTGTGSQTGLSRWGDYSNLSVDPVDDSTFWFTTEYVRGGWKTRVFSFNFAPLSPPEVNAGDDATVCQNTLFTTNGSVVSAKSWKWTTSGDGIIATPTNLSTYYLSGSQDIANGQATLTLTAQGYATGVETQDNMTLFITKNPSVFAGNDTLINNFTVFNTNASGENFGMVEWITAGDGEFENASSLNTIYTPGEEDINNESVELTLSASPIDPCVNDDSDKMVLSFSPTVGINEFAQDDVKLVINPNPSKGEFSIDIGQQLKADLTVKLLNNSGAVIFTEKALNVAAYNKSFNLQYLPKGIYFVKIEAGNISKTEKIILQ
jgi:hypothetical protein